MSRRRRVKKRRGCLRRLLLLLLLCMAGCGGALAYLLLGYPNSGGPGQGRAVTVEVPWGGSPTAVASVAAEGGAIRGPRRFAAYLRLSGAASRLQAGRHRVRDDWSPAEVARALSSPGLGAQVRLTHREGQSRFALATELDRLGVVPREAFLAATTDAELLEELEIRGESAEGYLYPETYMMEPGSEAAAVVKRLVSTFRERTAPLLTEHAAAIAALDRDLGTLEKTLAERRVEAGNAKNLRVFGGLQAAVILASIVEAETPHCDERPLVAAVFRNRLSSPEFTFRRLQADPTVRYGCEAEPDRASSCADGTGAITKTQLRDRDNRYNTYAHPSLPPGPIGNPSLSSLEAVLTPSDRDVLYFVVGEGGRHEFSETLEEHNAAVARYRATP